MKHILLALAAALSLTTAASAAGTQLEVHSPQGPVKAGETYQVTAELTGNPGFHSLQFALTFDVDTVECTRVQAGPLIQDALWAGNRTTVLGAAFAAAASETIEGDGTVAVFSFLAKDDLPAISVGVAELLFYDRDGAEFPCDTASVATADLAVGESGTAASPSEKPLPTTPPPHRSEEELAALEEELAALEEERRQNALSSSSGSVEADTPPVTSGTGQSTTTGGSPAATGGSAADGNGGSAADQNTASMGQNPSGGSSTAGENTGIASDKNTGSTEQTPSTGGSTVGGNTGSTDDAASPVFTDTAGIWAEAEIAEAARRDLFHGYADGSFRPNNPVTRGQYVLVLWNLAGRPAPNPEPGKTPPFRDLEGLSNEFRNAITWAWENGYVNGTAPDIFSSGGLLTRQAAMKILFGFNGGVSGTEIMLGGAYDSIFTDSASLSDWAREGVWWAVYHGILKGVNASTLNPRGGLTRAQLAAIMVRYTDRFPAGG